MYECKYCGNSFNTKQSLAGHIGHCEMNPEATTIFVCKHCGESIRGKLQLSRHENHCSNNAEHKEYPKIGLTRKPSNIENVLSNCSFCGKVCKNILSLRSHERLCSANPNRQKSNIELTKDTRVSWNKGKTKETDERVARNGLMVKEFYSTHPGSFAGKHHSADTIATLSKISTDSWHSDANRHVRSHSGWYDGIYFMSTWELAYYIYMKNHGHNIKRCDQRFQYEYEGKYHYYYPDFIVDGRIVETKGFETSLDRIKYQAVPDLIVVKEAEIEPMIEYVKSTYDIENLQQLYVKVEASC